MSSLGANHPTAGSAMRSMLAIVALAIVVFLVFTAYSVTQSVRSNVQLAHIRDLYFPVLEGVDANIVRLDKMQTQYGDAVAHGDGDLVQEADAMHRQVDRVFVELMGRDQAHHQEIESLRQAAARYQVLASGVAMDQLRQTADATIHARTAEMVRTLGGLQTALQRFRQSRYADFLQTLADAQRRATRNMYLGVALGVMNLFFIGVLVYFMRANMKMLTFIGEQNVSLEQRVAERTEALQRKTVEANAANEAKSRFLANMSHELRTPLNGVLGMSQLLLMPGLEHRQQQEYLNTILQSGRSLLQLLNDILDLSKVEAGKVELEALPFQPQQLLRETQLLFAPSLATKGLSGDVQWLGPEGMQVVGDAHRVRQMLGNLVSNAIKFTTSGSITLQAKVVQENAPGDAGEPAMAVLEWSVRDTGIGIPAEKQTRLFQPFTQVDSSTTREFGGTGLGLSIVRALAQLMGGDAGLESVVGEGTRVWFRMRVPVAPAAAVAVAPSAPVEVVQTVADAASDARWVLVVEDIELNRKVIGAMLKKMGLRYQCAENGQLALDMLVSGLRPAMVLMDCQMPVLDGYTATEKIRAWESENGVPRTPIVALTADAFEDDRQRCLAVGMDDYLAKPLDVAALARVLQAWNMVAT